MKKELRHGDRYIAENGKTYVWNNSGINMIPRKNVNIKKTLQRKSKVNEPDIKEININKPISNRYSDKLKDPRWQRKRLKIMERDEFMCQSCYDSENTLYVHHKFYIYGKEPWEYPDELLVTLCDACHKTEEDSKNIIKDFVKELLLFGYLASELKEMLKLIKSLPAGDYGMSFISHAVKSYKTHNIEKK